MLEWAVISRPETKNESGDGKLQPDKPGNAAAEEPFLIVLGKLPDPFHVEGDRFIEEGKYLFEGSALYCKIEIKADRLPFIIASESIAMQDTLHWDLLGVRSSRCSIRQSLEGNRSICGG